MTHTHTPVQPGTTTPKIIGGVDTHKDTHHAAAIDHLGRHLDDREFPATSTGYHRLLAWLNGFGPLQRVGVEGTGSYGAALTRHLTTHHITVIEVNRPDRAARRRTGKSDPADAYAAALAVLSDRATATPKNHTGTIEAIRVLHLTRAGLVKARTAAKNTLHNLIITADPDLREHLHGLTPARHLQACLTLHADPAALADPATATRYAVRALATRILAFTTEIRTYDTHLQTLITATAPTLLTLHGVRPLTPAQQLITAGENPHRLSSDAAFAALTGTSPVLASSGRTDRHRLNRGGDRHANAALHQIIVVRMKSHQPTRDYITKRTNDKLPKKHIMRCLKRYLAREIYRALRTDLTPTTPRHQ
jgi:transposase